ncbi:MAG: ABC transporter permease [Treponema sp.]|jgi:NitT/TauT family transport system permease protein|nr:ABC transporter permease [Treponema sp.]
MVLKNRALIQRPYKKDGNAGSARLGSMGESLRALERSVLKAMGLLVPGLLWELLSRLGFLDPQFVPSFLQALGGIVQTVEARLLPGSLIISLWRAMIGLFIASALAIPLGLIIGRDASGFGDCFNPLFRLLAQVNPFTLTPVFILFFGIGEGAKAGIVAWVCFWPVFFNTLEGARGVDPILLKTARGMGAPGSTLFLTVILPGAASSIFSGLKLGLEMSFFVLIAAEMIGASSGIGWLVQASYWNLRFSWMYGAMILSIGLGFCINGYLNRLYDKVFFWREEPVSLQGRLGREGRGKWKNNQGLPRGRRKRSKLPRRKPFTGRDFIRAAVLILLILLAGFWQIRETQKEWQQFGKEGHTSSGIGIFDD